VIFFISKQTNIILAPIHAQSATFAMNHLLICIPIDFVSALFTFKINLFLIFCFGNFCHKHIVIKLYKVTLLLRCIATLCDLAVIATFTVNNFWTVWGIGCFKFRAKGRRGHFHFFIKRKIIGFYGELIMTVLTNFSLTIHDFLNFNESRDNFGKFLPALRSEATNGFLVSFIYKILSSHCNRELLLFSQEYQLKNFADLIPFWLCCFA